MLKCRYALQCFLVDMQLNAHLVLVLLACDWFLRFPAPKKVGRGLQIALSCFYLNSFLKSPSTKALQQGIPLFCHKLRGILCVNLCPCVRPRTFFPKDVFSCWLKQQFLALEKKTFFVCSCTAKIYNLLFIVGRLATFMYFFVLFCLLK